MSFLAQYRSFFNITHASCFVRLTGGISKLLLGSATDTLLHTCAELSLSPTPRGCGGRSVVVAGVKLDAPVDCWRMVSRHTAERLLHIQHVDMSPRGSDIGCEPVMPVC
jgi:hypothetical protein